MPLAFGENLFGRRDVRETPAGTSTSTSSTSILAPVGSIMAWLKSFTNTPQALPSGWMEADGSAISDADSVYNGQNAPDLNGGEFIRGFTTSGGTGGSDTMAHTHTTNVTIDNHTALVITNESTHEHDFSDAHTHALSNNGWAELQSDGDTIHMNHAVASAWTSTHKVVGSTGGSDVAGSLVIGIELDGTTDSGTASGTTTNGDAHTHALTQNIDAHTENNPATSAASNTENRPPYYNVVWIFRFK